MHATARDLERTFQGNGAEFEGLIEALIRAHARFCGISSNDIDWDPRPSVRDGGQDILVRAGNPLGRGQFIPDRPSLWSIKSGADGVDPEKLKKEILPQPKKDHPKVREALQAGDVFVWCAAYPAGPDKRGEMREAANEITQQLGVNADQIEFRWQDGIAAEINRNPNVIAVHLPDVDNRWKGVRNLGEWQRTDNLTNTWKDFGGRAELVETITNHLLGRESLNVLHIAGLSGIGKSRSVLEACQRQEELKGVFYLGHLADLTPQLERAFEDTQRVLLVIDEVPLEEIERVFGRFANCAERVRIVTIGPASRQRPIAHRNIIVVPAPESEDDILAVIRSPGRDLSEEVLRSIAARSAHDLRLALKLVEASLLQPELRTIPIIDFNGVWNRLMRLFPSEIPDAAAFRQKYEILTTAIDVGFDEEFRPELTTLAECFGQSEGDLLDCLNVATNCGLGLRAGRFFETMPHALALGLFQSLFGRRLRDRLSEFMGRLPPRLLRRFLERCQECPDDVREEVAAAVGGVFLEWLDGIGIGVLANREASRVFQAWAEFDPLRGLAWLRRAVDNAAPQQLLALDGEPDGSGGWRGRRQLVWLCQNLACFTEYFRECEAVLFRLAQHETEKFLNNSTGVWQSLFLPALVQTEISFQERFQILLGRLDKPTREDLPLVLGAAFGTLKPNLEGFPLVRVVGGRIAPPAARLATIGEWRELRRAAAVGILAAIARLPQELIDDARREVLHRLRLLSELGFLEAVQNLFRTAPLSPELRRETVLELDRMIDFQKDTENRDVKNAQSQFAILEQWRLELATGDLATRVQDLTARNYYERFSQENTEAAYAKIADELIAAPNVFRSLEGWFENPAAKSAGPLGFALGKADSEDRIAESIHDWLFTDRCREVAIAYVNGAASRGSGLAARWVADLDALSAVNPEVTVLSTSMADVGSRGFERILAVVDRLPRPASRFLRVFGYGNWNRQLSVDQKQLVLQTLVRLVEAGDQLAGAVGVSLVHFWWHQKSEPLDDKLVAHAFRLAAQAPLSADNQNSYEWHAILRLLSRHDPVQVAQLIVDVLTGPSSPWRFDDDNIAVLAETGRFSPASVMEVIGRAILDPKQRTIFGIGAYPALFESIGVDAVKKWVNTHGRQNLRWIARHFPSPGLNAVGEVVIPSITEWLFTEHEDDQDAFEWFLMGRHSGAMMWEGDRTAKKQAEMEPFFRHKLRRVREWAEYEIGSVRREAEWFRQMDDEHSRL